MKKKIIFFVLTAAVITALLTVGMHAYYNSEKFDGTTTESRERLLSENIKRSKGKNWKILTETEVENYIISGAYSSDDKTTLAVFKSEKDGKYSFLTSVNGNKNEVLVKKFTTEDYNNYLITWFKGADTEYAEVSYYNNSEENQTVRYFKTDEILCTSVYSFDSIAGISYFDKEGNEYK